MINKSSLFHIPAKTARRQRKPARSRRDNVLRFEPLEPRILLTGSGGLVDWQSTIFDGGVSGDLPLTFTRNIETVDQQGQIITANEPRFGASRLLTESSSWSIALNDVGNYSLIGSGWDHHGTTPLALLWSRGSRTLRFIQGESFSVVSTVNLKANDGDLLQGEVEGFRHYPRNAVVHEGLVVFLAERSRRESDQWIPEGISIIYTQDHGQTFHRVADTSGGFVIPGIAGDVSAGMSRGQRWSFANAFPEKSADDLLGAWFPWADYLYKKDKPKGGQIGLFRARREAVGEAWTVEPNRVVYETWREADAGGYHAHTAGMFVDGMASFWGDVGYRNQMVRHVADDLENYTTTTWTHQEGFHGGWSPADAKVYTIGNQAVSAAPGPVHGEFLVSGDEQPEVILKIQRPESVGEKAIITNLRGSFLGRPRGSSFAPRLALWFQHVRGVGYVAVESNSRFSGTNTLHYSPDGKHWGNLLDIGASITMLYGSNAIAMSNGDLYAMELPKSVAARSPLMLNPGGTNLASETWTEIAPPGDGNQFRRVLYQDGQYIYEDNSQPISPQPPTPPPTASGMPLWEITSNGSSRSVGDWNVTDTASDGTQLHWHSAWHYSLDGNGISPQTIIGTNNSTSRQSPWRANSHWVPSLNSGVPNPGQAEPALQPLRFRTGINAGPRRWLMATEGFVQSDAPTYPLSPGTSGPNELASVQVVGATENWSAGLTFGLPQLSSFSSQFDASPVGTRHPIATIQSNSSDYIDVTFTRTTQDAGLLALSRYDNNALISELSFSSLYLDREDLVHLLISSSPEEFGATFLATRNAYGLKSDSVLGDFSSFVPNKIFLSDGTQTVVSPMEWYAVQVSTSQSLTTDQREQMIRTDRMFEDLGAVKPTGPDFDQNGTVDGADFLAWQQGYGTTFLTGQEDGDANLDGLVDHVDLAHWSCKFGAGLDTSPPSADFDASATVDHTDLAIFETGFGSHCGAQHSQGDTDHDLDVDGADFLVWQRQYNGAAQQSPIEAAITPSDSSQSEAPAPLRLMDAQRMPSSTNTLPTKNELPLGALSSLAAQGPIASRFVDAAIAEGHGSSRGELLEHEDENNDQLEIVHTDRLSQKAPRDLQALPQTHTQVAAEEQTEESSKESANDWPTLVDFYWTYPWLSI